MRLRVLRLLPVAMLAFASCGENDFFNKGAGRIDVSASVDTSVDAAVSTRAIANAMHVELDSCTLSVVKTDGSAAPFVGKFADYISEMEIGVGTYNVSLEYGSFANEGFNHPYYYASEEVTVADQQTTTLALDAKLKSTMIIVQFSEAFDLYFRSYEVTLQSPSGSSYTWVEEENRPLYLQPGDINLSMKLRTVTGKQMTLDAPTIHALEGTMYNVSLDVNGGEVGKAAISISFDDATERKPIYIEINDDIIDADAPTIEVVGFESGKLIDVIEGEGADVKPKFHIIATAGIKEVWLTTTGDYLLGQGMPHEVNLASSELAPETIGILNSLGLVTKGLLTGKDKMAVVDLSGLVQSLRANSQGDATTFSVRVVDAYDRCYPEDGMPEPTLVVDAEKLQFSISDAETIPVGATETSFVVTTNGKGDELMQNLEVTALDTDGIRNTMEIKSVEAVEGNDIAYKVTIELPLRNSNPGIECLYRGGVIAPKTSVAMEYSEAQTTLRNLRRSQNRIVIRVENKALMRLARALYIDNKEVPVLPSMRDNAAGEILICENVELKPSTTYKVALSFLENPSPDNAPSVSVTTEAPLGVPNGDFEDLEAGISRNDMDQGGVYTHTNGWIKDVEMQNHQTFELEKPEGWNTTNRITASSEAKVQNSWFVIPSVFNTTLSWTSKIAKDGAQGGQTATPDAYKNLPKKSGNNAMVIRNVAYDHNGVVPAKDKDTKTSANFYCRNIPNTIASRMAGRLALGDDGNGADFRGTPKALNLWYIFKQDPQNAEEMGTVEIQLLHHDENSGQDIVVATGSGVMEQAGNDFTQLRVPITYSSIWKRPSTLKIIIRSSNKPDAEIKVTNHISLHEASAYGAQLIVDSLTFEY